MLLIIYICQFQGFIPRSKPAIKLIVGRMKFRAWDYSKAGCSEVVVVVAIASTEDGGHKSTLIRADRYIVR